MHPSYFHISNIPESDPSGSLHLSAEASEWLFYIKFWDAVNAELASSFGQYEDDVLPSNRVADVLRMINDLEDRCLREPPHTQNVVYGWTQQGEELWFSIKKETLCASLRDIKLFLRKAIDLHSDIYCQL